MIYQVLSDEMEKFESVPRIGNDLQLLRYGSHHCPDQGGVCVVVKKLQILENEFAVELPLDLLEELEEASKEDFYNFLKQCGFSQIFKYQSKLYVLCSH